MKKETKASIIIFCVVFIVAYIMSCFIPNEVLQYSAQNTVFTFFGDMTVALVGMRGILSFAFALIAVLLIKIVSTEEEEKSKNKNTKTEKKENKNETK